MVNPRYSFSNITTNTTTIIRRGTGVLHAVVINIKGAAANTITIYDNSTGSGTKIGTIDSTVQPGTFLFDALFTNGLTIVTATGTPADITVTFI